MSTELPRFLLEATLVWTALLAFYLVAFRRSANWRARRRFLLTAFGLGILIPLLPPITLAGPVAAARLPADLVGYIVPATGPATAALVDTSAYNWPQIFLVAWVSGTLLHLIVAFAGLLRHLRPAAPSLSTYAGFTVVCSARIRTPYAACGKIYLPAGLPDELEHTALLHEAAHLRHGHFRERLLLLLGTAIFWFHPLSWVYARLLSEVHEYEADAEVTRHIPVKTYGRQLLQATLAPRLVPALFSSPLKKRIMMLTQNRSARRLGLGHYGGYAILLAFLLVACSGETFAPLSAQTVPPLTYTPSAAGAEPSEPTLATGEYSTFVQAFYARVNYPRVPLQRNEMARIQVAVQIAATGQVTDVITTKAPLEGKEEGITQLNVIAPANPEVSDFIIQLNQPDEFTTEVERVIAELGPFKPASREGEPAASTLKFEVLFMPEE